MHELRSPLNALTLVAQILRLNEVDPVTREKSLGTLERQTAYMRRLVDDLFELSRASSGKVSLQLEALDLRTVFVHALELAQPLIERHKQHLELLDTAEPVWVNGDSVRLVQVLANLITNASKFSPEGGHIRLYTRYEGDTVVARVQDDGIGISTEMLSQVIRALHPSQSSQAR